MPPRTPLPMHSLPLCGRILGRSAGVSFREGSSADVSGSSKKGRGLTSASGRPQWATVHDDLFTQGSPNERSIVLQLFSVDLGATVLRLGERVNAANFDLR